MEEQEEGDNLLKNQIGIEIYPQIKLMMKKIRRRGSDRTETVSDSTTGEGVRL